MTAQGHGAVVHVSSAAARAVPTNGVPYSTAKAALNAYSKGLANAVGPRGVRVNTVMPGMIGSERFEQTMAGRAQQTGQDPAAYQHLVAAQAGVTLGRVGTVEEAAEVITFLASPRSSYLTGIEVPVDGGLLPML
jgi:NAD(P)-dependent dehydrogenase (short-subunit alcohol dehydrogenase family)